MHHCSVLFTVGRVQVHENFAPIIMCAQDMASLSAAAEAAQAELSAQLSALHARWLARESRPEDVTAIAGLRSVLVARDEAVRVAEEQLAQLRAQMLLREDNYNKHFKYADAVQTPRADMCKLLAEMHCSVKQHWLLCISVTLAADMGCCGCIELLMAAGMVALDNVY